MGKQEHLAFLDGLFYLLKQKDADVVDNLCSKQKVYHRISQMGKHNNMRWPSQGQQLYQAKNVAKTSE
jgi:hypothetical protein